MKKIIKKGGIKMDIVIYSYEERESQVSVYINDEFAEIFDEGTYEDSLMAAVKWLERDFGKLRVVSRHTNTRGYDVTRLIKV